MCTETPGSILRPNEKQHHHYFAIGAMMNPQSVKNRKLNLEINAVAVPGFLEDHKLVFFGSSGFAEVVYAKGSLVHGVVYRRVPDDQMKILDNIERDYIRKEVPIHCYTQDDLSNSQVLENVSVYCRAQEDIEKSKSIDKPPSERYLQVLMEGAKHYGVDPKYIQFLKEHECRPRPVPSEYLTFPEVEGFEGRRMTREEVDRVGNGLDGNSLCIRSRGRVIELLLEPETVAIHRDYTSSFQQLGRDMELFMSRIQYDPKFGIPSCLEEVTPEHAAYTEHAFCEYFLGCNALHKWRVIARIQD